MESRRSWLGPSIVLLFLLLYTVIAGIVFCFNALILFLQKDFNLSLTVLEWLGALPASIPMLAAPAAMVLNFKIGTWTTLLAGIILITTGLGFSALAQHIGVLFFTYGTLATIGITLSVNPPMFLIDQIYPYDHPRHVLATSISACGFPLAALIMVPTADKLAESIGWKMTYLTLGLTTLVAGVPLIILARLWAKSNCEKEELHTDTKSDVTNVEEVAYSSKRRILMFVLWFVASFTKCFAYYTPMLTLIKHMDSMGIGGNLSWQVMPVVGASELLSRLLASYLGDRIKGKTLYMYLVSCLSLAIVNLFGPLFTSYVHFMVYGAALGLFGGPIIAALYSCSAEVLAGKEVTLLFSIFRSGMGVATMVGPVIAGAMSDTIGTFQPMFYAYSACYFITFFIYVAIIAINRWRPISNTQVGASLLGNLTSSLNYQTLSYEEINTEDVSR